MAGYPHPTTPPRRPPLFPHPSPKQPSPHHPAHPSATLPPPPGLGYDLDATTGIDPKVDEDHTKVVVTLPPAFSFGRAQVAEASSSRLNPIPTTRLTTPPRNKLSDPVSSPKPQPYTPSKAPSTPTKNTFSPTKPFVATTTPRRKTTDTSPSATPSKASKRKREASPRATDEPASITTDLGAAGNRSGGEASAAVVAVAVDKGKGKGKAIDIEGSYGVEEDAEVGEDVEEDGGVDDDGARVRAGEEKTPSPKSKKRRVLDKGKGREVDAEEVAETEGKGKGKGRGKGKARVSDLTEHDIPIITVTAPESFADDIDDLDDEFVPGYTLKSLSAATKPPVGRRLRETETVVQKPAKAKNVPWSLQARVSLMTPDQRLDLLWNQPELETEGLGSFGINPETGYMKPSSLAITSSIPSPSPFAPTLSSTPSLSPSGQFTNWLSAAPFASTATTSTKPKPYSGPRIGVRGDPELAGQHFTGGLSAEDRQAFAVGLWVDIEGEGKGKGKGKEKGKGKGKGKMVMAAAGAGGPAQRGIASSSKVHIKVEMKDREDEGEDGPVIKKVKGNGGRVKKVMKIMTTDETAHHPPPPPPAEGLPSNPSLAGSTIAGPSHTQPITAADPATQVNEEESIIATSSATPGGIPRPQGGAPVRARGKKRPRVSGSAAVPTAAVAPAPTEANDEAVMSEILKEETVISARSSVLIDGLRAYTRATVSELRKTLHYKHTQFRLEMIPTSSFKPVLKLLRKRAALHLAKIASTLGRKSTQETVHRYYMAWPLSFAVVYASYYDRYTPPHNQHLIRPHVLDAWVEQLKVDIETEILEYVGAVWPMERHQLDAELAGVEITPGVAEDFGLDLEVDYDLGMVSEPEAETKPMGSRRACRKD